MNRKRRSLNQIKEEISYQILRRSIPETWVIHEYGPDYGIDCVVELFDYVDDEQTIAETLGESFFVQLKASGSIEYRTKRVYPRLNIEKARFSEDKSEYLDIEVAKFKLEMSEILTVQAMGTAIPVLLILVDVNTERAFFLCLNDYIDKFLIPEDPDYSRQASKTLYIPLKNEIKNLDRAIMPLRHYGKRSKMYGSFNKFSYQKKELEYAYEYLIEVSSLNPDEIEQYKMMIAIFTESIIRLDIWNSYDFWKPVEFSFKELCDLKINLDKGISLEDNHGYWIRRVLEIWNRLANIGAIYEETIREWFMPTFLSQYLSYSTIPEPITSVRS